MCLRNFQMIALRNFVLHFDLLLFESTKMIGILGVHSLLENVVAYEHEPDASSG